MKSSSTKGEHIMKHCLFVVLFLFIFTGGTAFGRFSPDFSFTDLDGQIYSSTSLRNTPVVVYIGSTY